MVPLLEDQGMGQVLATDGHARVVRHHRLDAMVRRLLGIYQEVLARRCRTQRVIEPTPRNAESVGRFATTGARHPA